MYLTVGYIFVEKEAPHNTRIEYERADIDNMIDDPKYILVGRCIYNTETKTIKEVYL